MVHLAVWILNIEISLIVARSILYLLALLPGKEPHSLLIYALYFAIKITEPIIGPLRRVLPKVGMIDFSPMVAIIFLAFIKIAVIESV